MNQQVIKNQEKNQRDFGKKQVIGLHIKQFEERSINKLLWSKRKCQDGEEDQEHHLAE